LQNGEREYNEEQQKEIYDYEKHNIKFPEVTNDDMEEEDDNDYEDDDATEEMESPKYNGSNENAAPKPNRNRLQDFTKKDNFLYQIKMGNDEKKKYFLDNFPNKNYRSHLTPTRKYNLSLSMFWFCFWCRCEIHFVFRMQKTKSHSDCNVFDNNLFSFLSQF